MGLSSRREQGRIESSYARVDASGIPVGSFCHQYLLLPHDTNLHTTATLHHACVWRGGGEGGDQLCFLLSPQAISTCASTSTEAQKRIQRKSPRRSRGDTPSRFNVSSTRVHMRSGWDDKLNWLRLDGCFSFSCFYVLLLVHFALRSCPCLFGCPSLFLVLSGLLFAGVFFFDVCLVWLVSFFFVARCPASYKKGGEGEGAVARQGGSEGKSTHTTPKTDSGAGREGESLRMGC